MVEIFEKVKKLAKKYYLDENKFFLVNLKDGFKKKKFIFYGKNEYFFEISNKKNFFPYYEESAGCSDLENWLRSILKTSEQHFKIIKDLDKSKEDRSNFKKKYNV